MKELIDWDQRRQDTQIKYEQVVSQFDPKGLADSSLSVPKDTELDGPLTLTNVAVTDGGTRPVVEHVSMTLALDETVAMTGRGASRVIEAIARLRPITSGEIRFGEQGLAEMPNSVFGRCAAYLGSAVYLRGPSVFDTLAYPLKRCPSDLLAVDDWKAREAKRAGNPEDNPDADWIDYGAVGAADTDDLRAMMLDAMNLVEMEDDLFSWGLQEVVETDPDRSRSILRARRAVSGRLERDELSALVERFDAGSFNGNATVAENLRFGAAMDAAFSDVTLAKNPIMRRVLRDVGLEAPLIKIGQTIGAMLLEIFQDVSAENTLVEKFSFVDAAELPRIRTLLERDAEKAEDRESLIALAFSYIDVRHRLGVLDTDLIARIVEARQQFRTIIEKEMPDGVAFYDPEKPTVGIRLIDDILHGRISNGVARAHDRVEALIFEALDAEGLLPVVLGAGLNYEIGAGGKRLNASQRQRIGLAQAMVRRPQLLLLNDAMIVVDELQARRILTRVVGLREGKATIAALARPQYASIFGRRISFEDGRLLTDEMRAGDTSRTSSGSELDDEVAVLAQTPLFANLEQGTLKLLAFASRRVTFAAGQDVFRQGDRADCAYVVISGSASVLYESAEGITKINTIEKNHFVGEVAILSDGVRTATVRASSELIALEIDREMFLQLIRDFPDIAIEVMRDLGIRLQVTTSQVVPAR